MKAAFVGSSGFVGGSGLKSCSSLCKTKSSLKMGYGDYSISTDKTQGHTNNYYVDKFRTKSDFGVKKLSSDAQASMLGRTGKGAVTVPKYGIPQMDDDVLGFGPDSMMDPRIAESEGAVYRWDPNYVDESKTLASCADIDDEDVASNAFSAYSGSMVAERAKMLMRCKQATEYAIAAIKGGELDEIQLLTATGQRRAQFARTEKIANIMTFTPTGQPMTEIPGTNYLPAVGAMDFIETSDVVGKETMGTFWKEPKKEITYKRPLGAATPELPYNSPRLLSSS